MLFFPINQFLAHDCQYLVSFVCLIGKYQCCHYRRKYIVQGSYMSLYYSIYFGKQNHNSAYIPTKFAVNENLKLIIVCFNWIQMTKLLIIFGKLRFPLLKCNSWPKSLKRSISRLLSTSLLLCKDTEFRRKYIF